MKKLKQLKKKLKKNNLLFEYKNKFKHKQMRFAISKIAMIYYPTISLDDLFILESNILNQDIGPEMFISSFKMFKKISGLSSDWESFGKFMWYQFQVSTYYKDVKKGNNNIFIENEVKKNQEKRILFLKWLHSVDKTEENFNQKIIKLQKKIF